MKRKRLRFGRGFRVAIGNREIRNTGRGLLKTLNFYVPPAYSRDGEELPAGKPADKGE